MVLFTFLKALRPPFYYYYYYYYYYYLVQSNCEINFNVNLIRCNSLGDLIWLRIRVERLSSAFWFQSIELIQMTSFHFAFYFIFIIIIIIIIIIWFNWIVTLILTLTWLIAIRLGFDLIKDFSEAA